MTTTAHQSGLLNAEQLARAEALRVAANVLGGRPLMSNQGAVPPTRPTADVLALAEWLLDGTRELEAATLESFDTHSDESDDPVRTDVRVFLPVPEPYRTDTDVDRLVVVGREDLAVLLRNCDGTQQSQSTVFPRLLQAARA